MKKLTLIFLAIFLFTLIPDSSFAQGISQGVISTVSFTQGDTAEVIDIETSGYSDYGTMRLQDPDRIVIDVYNVRAPSIQQLINAGGKYANTVRYAQFDVGIGRVVIDALGNPDFRVEKTETGLRVTLMPPKSIGSPDTDSPSDNGSSTPVIDTLKHRIDLLKNFRIEYQSSESGDEFAFVLPAYKGYKVTRLTGPDRLFIDIPGIASSIKDKKVDIKGSHVTTLRYSKHDKNTLRTVLDLSGQAAYSIEERKGSLYISVQASGLRNISYSNNGDRVYLSLEGIKLTDDSGDLIKFYNEEYAPDDRKYTITFPSSLGDIGSGILRVNDEYINTLEITNNPESQTTSITIDAKGLFKYLPYYRSDVKNSNITILKPAAEGEKLVVIDAGHGGMMSGATYRSLMEKDLNLDIAKRLDRLLGEKKVRTYMIRENDGYVDNYERAYIANTLNATLYISIHNNAIGDPGFGGTMTLYFPYSSADFNGKMFAQLVQNRLLYRLKTTNRKIVERPNLIVLKETMMPSVLAEVAYMTNKKDRTNLMNSQFREKAALAISEGVIQALGKFK